jgi:hypothetical protein
VVLPFSNLSGDPTQEYFVDGVTESLTTDLSRISGSFVIGRHTAFTYKGKAIDLKQIGRELNVRYVLEGSVQRSGNRYRVSVQLNDSRTGNHLWAPNHAWAQLVLGAVLISSNRGAQGIAVCERERWRWIAIWLRRTYKSALSSVAWGEEPRLRRISTKHFDFLLAISSGIAGSEWSAYPSCIFRRMQRRWAGFAVASKPTETIRSRISGSPLLGLLDEARAAAKAGLALDPSFTVRRYRDGAFSDDPTYLAKRERIYQGMRIAGVPET